MRTEIEAGDESIHFRPAGSLEKVNGSMEDPDNDHAELGTQLRDSGHRSVFAHLFFISDRILSQTVIIDRIGL